MAKFKNITWENEGDCKLLTSHSTATEGYGRVNFKGKRHFLHRLVWATHNGPIPEGMKLAIIASRTGQTIISGSDIFDSWTFIADDAWEAPWPYNLFSPEPQWSIWFPAAPKLLKRTEIFFVDGIRLEQVANYNDLVADSFFIAVR